jgi:hypothetical protein
MKIKKWTVVPVALALTAAAVTVPAQAYENPNGGQHFDRGRFPRTIHIVAALSVASIAVAVLMLSKDNQEDNPLSP